MNYKHIAVLATIGLLITTGIVSAGSLSLKRADWNSQSHVRGYGGQFVTTYFDNYNGQPQTAWVALQLSIPGWYTRTFQQQVTIPGGAKFYPVNIGFQLLREWPAGGYKAQITTSNLVPGGVGGLSGVINVI